MNLFTALKFYDLFVKRDSLAFDIGAGAYADDESCGDRTAVFRTLGAKVVAVEPQVQAMKFLQSRFDGDRNITLIEKAVSNRPVATDVMYELHRERVVMATLNPQFVTWCDHTKMFGDGEWKKRAVQVTTLNALIEHYGVPQFIKIDVETSDSLVVDSLDTAVKSLSFEFHPWNEQGALEAVDTLATLGDYEFNFSLFEELTFTQGWMDAEAMKAAIKKLVGVELTVYGDIYARLK